MGSSIVETVGSKLSSSFRTVELRLEMACNSTTKSVADEKKEAIKQIAKRLCDDYIEDRLIRAGLQLKERTVGANNAKEKEMEGEGATNRPSQMSLTSRNRSRSNSNLNSSEGIRKFSYNPKLTRSLSTLPPSLEREEKVDANRHRLLPLPIDKKNTSDISRLFIHVGEMLETRHSGTYVDILARLNITLISELTLKRAFMDVAKYLFSEGVTWAKIVSLYAFAGGIAVDCVSHGANMYVGKLKMWTVQFLSDELTDWIVLQGGWSGMVDSFVEERKSHFPVMVLAFLSVLVVVAAYLVNRFFSLSPKR